MCCVKNKGKGHQQASESRYHVRCIEAQRRARQRHEPHNHCYQVCLVEAATKLPIRSTCDPVKQHRNIDFPIGASVDRANNRV